jgi:hypothetical protein
MEQIMYYDETIAKMAATILAGYYAADISKEMASEDMIRAAVEQAVDIVAEVSKL